MIKKIRISLCAIYLAILSLAALAENELLPEGFENLTRSQKTTVDIYYANRFVMTTRAAYTPSTIEFETPDLIIEKIPDAINFSTLTKGLTGELSKNEDLICYTAGQVDCGLLKPGVIGVIFDDTRFRADLFIHPDYLQVKPVVLNRFLPDSNASPSVIQNITGNISGNLNGDNNQRNHTIFGDTLFSYQENIVRTSWDQSRDQNFSVSQLLYERDYQGQQWQAGLVNSNGFGLGFSSTSRLWGARVSSSFNTRTDQAYSQGTPLDIFIPLTGRYEVIRDERLIDSGFIAAGSQSLDTSNYPGGAYDLLIRLYDEQGNLIGEESRFFAKQNRLPPADAPEYFIEAGRVAEAGAERILPDLTDIILGRVGANFRLLDTLSGTMAVATTPGQTIGEGTAFHIGRNYEVFSAILLGGNDDYGVRGEVRYRLGDLSLSGNWMQLWRGSQSRNSEEFNLLGNAFRQKRFTVDYPLFGGNGSYRFNDDRNKNIDDELTGRTIRQTLGYRRQIYRDTLYSISMQLNTTWTSDDDLTGLVSVELRQSRDNWSIQLNPQQSYERNPQGDSATEGSLLLAATYDDNDTFSGNLRSTLRARKTSNRVFSAGLTSRYSSIWGNGDLNLNYADNNSSSSTSYSASLSTSFIANGDTIAFGGESGSEAAIVVVVEGAELNEKFDVYVNDQRRSYALGGKPSIIQLTPFETYKIRIKQENASLFSVDEKEYEVTLYPGNVMALEYNVEKVFVVYGRVRLPNGEWLSNASVEGGQGFAVSDEFGLFQAEVVPSTDILIFRRQNLQCALPLSLNDYKDNFINLGQVSCQFDLVAKKGS